MCYNERVKTTLDLVNMATKTPTRLYWGNERTNIMLELIWGENNPHGEFTRSHSVWVNECVLEETAYWHFVSELSVDHPIRREHKTLKRFMKWFDKTYPVDPAYLELEYT